MKLLWTFALIILFSPLLYLLGKKLIDFSAAESNKISKEDLEAKMAKALNITDTQDSYLSDQHQVLEDIVKLSNLYGVYKFGSKELLFKLNSSSGSRWPSYHNGNGMKLKDLRELLIQSNIYPKRLKIDKKIVFGYDINIIIDEYYKIMKKI